MTLFGLTTLVKLTTSFKLTGVTALVKLTALSELIASFNLTSLTLKKQTLHPCAKITFKKQRNSSAVRPHCAAERPKKIF